MQIERVFQNNYYDYGQGQPIKTNAGKASPHHENGSPTGIQRSYNPNDPIGSLLEVYDDIALKQTGIVECVTCASRTYQDGSNDPGVSFKAPTHISPGQSAAAVSGHEQEHVVREQAKAKQEGGEVIAQSVSLFTSSCPECGRTYTSGGVTKTTVKYSNKQNSEDLKGKMINMAL